MLFNTYQSRNWRLIRCITAIIIVIIMIIIIIYFDRLWSPRYFGNLMNMRNFGFMLLRYKKVYFYFQCFISVKLVIFIPETNMVWGSSEGKNN